MQFSVYHREIFDFTRTMCIKFSILEENVAKHVYSQYGYEVKSPLDNPYYWHLCGLYHSVDKPIYINDPSGSGKILFSRETLDNNPKLKLNFKVNSDQYRNLMQAHPNRSGFIKHVVYPGCNTVEEAVEAEDLSLLFYDGTLVDTNEKEKLVLTTKKFLRAFRKRWYVEDYVYEDLYPGMLYSLIWTVLPCILFAQRVANIKTSDVHPFHVWEYLKSKGLQNYSAILSTKQSLFLYRNIDYILKNKGKMSNLELLADNLLSDVKVSLVQKIIQQDTTPLIEECHTDPMFVSKNVIVKNGEDYTGLLETPDQIMSRVHNEGKDPTYSPETAEKTVERLQTSPCNEALSKFLELKQDTISTRYQDMLSAFLFDSLLLNCSTDSLQYWIKFRDPMVKSQLKCYPRDMIVLLLYAISKSCGVNMVHIPQIYQFSTAYKKHKPTIPDHFHLHGERFNIDDVLPVDNIVSGIPFDEGEIYESPEEFNNRLCAQFLALYSHVLYHSAGRGLAELTCMAVLYDRFFERECLPLHLAEETTFSEFFENHEELKTVVDGYNALSDPVSHYKKLSMDILEKLIPTSDERLRPFIGINPSVHKLYYSLKELFIQLCSYTINFLDTTREKREYIFNIPYSGMLSGENHTTHNTALPISVAKLQSFHLDHFWIREENTSRVLSQWDSLRTHVTCPFGMGIPEYEDSRSDRLPVFTTRNVTVHHSSSDSMESAIMNTHFISNTAL